MRIVLYTGKGGVGKTSMSAATALRCAELGYRTVVVSTDPAHSLGDSFDRAIGNELVELAPNLWGQEIDLLNQMDKYWGKVQAYLNALFAWRGMDGLVAEETSVLPGMEELACLMQITFLADSGNYDVVIIDAAPTGSTLQLLSIPDIARWYIEKIFPFQRTTAQIARPLLRRFSDIPLPEDDMFASIEELVNYLERTSELLSDPTVSSMRVVLNPEKMVVKEAQRAYTYLSLYGYPVDAVICNRVFPKNLADDYFDVWKTAQSDNLALVHEAFQPLPIFEVPLFRQEVTGLAMLQLMAQTVFGDNPVRGGEGDPTRYFYTGKAQEIFRQNGNYVLSIPLPLVEHEQVHLHRSVFDELVIRIGNWKRNISLPMGLAKLEIEGAKYVDDRLNILFTIPDNEQAPPPETLKSNAWQSLKARFGRLSAHQHTGAVPRSYLPISTFRIPIDVSKVWPRSNAVTLLKRPSWSICWRGRRPPATRQRSTGFTYSLPTVSFAIYWHASATQAWPKRLRPKSFCDCWRKSTSIGSVRKTMSPFFRRGSIAWRTTRWWMCCAATSAPKTPPWNMQPLSPWATPLTQSKIGLTFNGSWSRCKF